MKSLKQLIEDCVFATPLNTVGMGNPVVDMDGISTEPICGAKPQKRVTKKKKKMKSLKSYL